MAAVVAAPEGWLEPFPLQLPTPCSSGEKVRRPQQQQEPAAVEEVVVPVEQGGETEAGAAALAAPPVWHSPG